MSIAATIPSRNRSRLVLGSSKSSIITRITGTTCGIATGGAGTDSGGIKPAAVVVTVTCAFCAVVPSAAVTGVTTTQVVLVGAPVQVSPTA